MSDGSAPRTDSVPHRNTLFRTAPHSTAQLRHRSPTETAPGISPHLVAWNLSPLLAPGTPHLRLSLVDPPFLKPWNSTPLPEAWNPTDLLEPGPLHFRLSLGFPPRVSPLDSPLLLEAYFSNDRIPSVVFSTATSISTPHRDSISLEASLSSKPAPSKL